MEIPKDIPEGVALLCECLHTQAEHAGADAEGLGTGACTRCLCKQFNFSGQAQSQVENPFYRAPDTKPSFQPRTEVPLLRATRPPPPATWWQRNFLRRWIRNLVGVTQDMENGTMYMQLTTTNIVHQAKLLQGLRADIDAANSTQNPVNDLVIELERRLRYYESKQGSALNEQYKELMKIDEKERKRKEREAALAELEAANKRIAERKAKTDTGEFIDCPKCEGSGQGEGVDICTECLGSGVVPNPDYIPPQPESEFNDVGVSRHLHLEG